MATYDIPEYPTKRLRYFNNQFLNEQDFIDGDAYQVAHERAHLRALCVAGIGEGLVVSFPDPAKPPMVSPGIAIDRLGRMIVLAQPTAASSDIPAKLLDGDHVLYISFGEVPTDMAAEASGGTQDNTRWTQQPTIAAARSGAVPGGAVVLGTFRVTAGLVDGSRTPQGRQYSGLGLPGPGAALSLAAQSDGRLALSGALDVRADTLGPILRVINGAGAPMFSVDGAGATTVGKLSVTGELAAPGGVRLSDGALWLRSDGNHGLSWRGQWPAAEAVDGPVLFGFRGGALGTMQGGAKAALSWESSGAVSIGGTLGFGATTRQMLNLWGTNYGAGVQDFTLYLRTDRNLAVFQGGTHAAGELDPGGGVAALVLRNGNLGLGTSDPAGHRLRVSGSVLADNGLRASGLNVGTNGAQTTYSWPYESIGTDAPGHNLRLFSRNFVYVHAPLGFHVARAEGGNGNLTVDGTASVGTLAVTGAETRLVGTDNNGNHTISVGGVVLFRIDTRNQRINMPAPWTLVGKVVP
jgi:hypothetical protein